MPMLTDSLCTTVIIPNQLFSIIAEVTADRALATKILTFWCTGVFSFRGQFWWAAEKQAASLGPICLVGGAGDILVLLPNTVSGKGNVSLALVSLPQTHSERDNYALSGN